MRLNLRREIGDLLLGGGNRNSAKTARIIDVRIHSLGRSLRLCAISHGAIAVVMSTSTQVRPRKRLYSATSHSGSRGILRSCLIIRARNRQKPSTGTG